MYKKSIRDNSKFLTPFVEGVKYYGSNDVEQGIGTMMILNENGDILTCKHIAEQFLISEQLKRSFKEISRELELAKNSSERKKIEKKYNLKKDTLVLSEINVLFINNDANGNSTFDIILHDNLDMAIIRPRNAKIKIDNYPVFSKNIPEQGQSICRIGFAFPEYDIYKYSNNLKSIVIKEKSKLAFPVFPNDGIVTRHIVDDENHIYAFETSSPGLRGQSGGPIFGPDGLVYGMQYMTKHLDLNFDVNKVVKRGIKDKQINYTPFINLGAGITSVEIIKFLENNKVKYYSN